MINLKILEEREKKKTYRYLFITKAKGLAMVRLDCEPKQIWMFNIITYVRTAYSCNVQ